MNPVPFVKTNNSITVVVDGKTIVAVKGSPQYTHLDRAINNTDWDAVAKCSTIKSTIENWMLGKFTYENGKFTYPSMQLPEKFQQRLITMTSNNEDPSPLFRFWEKLQQNPSFRSVSQLWGFLEHKHIPLTRDGYFLGYKSVDENFKDWHSRQFINTPGTTNEMPRNQISDDQTVDCAQGFHVGTLAYAKEFNNNNDQRIVICKINPADVVSVPDDASSQKVRVCKYTVVGHWNGEPMSSTTIVDEYCDTIEDNKIIPEAGETKTKAEDFSYLEYMGTKDMLDEKLEVLRRYAGSVLKIVGASKISGGKSALIHEIISTRTKMRRRKVVSP